MAETTDKAPTLGEVMNGLSGLESLSKIGTKKEDMIKRLARMIRWSRKALENFFIERDTLNSTWAERDEAGEIKVRTSADGKSQEVVFRNQAEYQLALNSLLRQKVQLDEAMPEPFNFNQLSTQFLKLPDAELLARLGPFAILD